MKHEQPAAGQGATGPGVGAASANGTASGTAQSGIAREYHNFVTDIAELIASTKASVGISAGLGILIGCVLGRSRRDS